MWIIVRIVVFDYWFFGGMDSEGNGVNGMTWL